MAYSRKTNIPLVLPLTLFLISALVGVWASYDQRASWIKFALIAIGVAAYILIVVVLGQVGARRTSREDSEPNRWLSTFVWVLVSVSAALAVLYVTQYDFGAKPTKIAFLTEIGRLLNAVTPNLSALSLERDGIVGTLEITFPIALVLAYHTRHKTPRTSFIAALILTLLIGFGLAMASSVRTWFALGVVLGGGVFLLERERLRGLLPLWQWILIALGVGLVVLVAVFLAAGPNSVNYWLSGVPFRNRLFGFFESNAQTWRLIHAYFFTGSGLGVYAMVLSTYDLLMQVPFLYHTNNTFLQIWIEQGILGIIGFVWLWTAFYYYAWMFRADLNWLAKAGLLAATAMFVHDLVDVRLYATKALPMMFVPLALTVAAICDVRLRRAAVTKVNRSRLVLVAPLAFAVILAGLVLINNPRALWYVNLGSVSQTRIELGQYSFPERLPEFVRRDTDLSQAESFFQQALASDQGNVVANQRLGAIALARGNYELAKTYFESAYQRDATNGVTQRLLGDAYLALGEMEQARAVWSQIGDASVKLQIDGWLYFQTRGDQERAARASEFAQQITPGGATQP